MLNYIKTFENYSNENKKYGGNSWSFKRLFVMTSEQYAGLQIIIALPLKSLLTGGHLDQQKS